MSFAGGRRVLRVAALFAALVVASANAYAWADEANNAPEQVHLSLGVLPTEMTVAWVTPSASASDVRVGLSSGQYTMKFSGSSDKYTWQSYTSGALHTALMTGLSVSTKYYYQVGDSAANLWSDEFSFTTVPNKPVPANYALIGDIGQTSNSQNTLDGIAQEPLGNTDLLLHVGDLSYANGDEPLWDSYGRMMQQVAAKKPYMLGVGNHEAYCDFIPVIKRYPMPGPPPMNGSFYYAFTHAMTRFVWLSTETDYSKDGAQYKWAQQEFASINRTETPWVVALWHRPIYNSNTCHHGEGDAFKAIWEDLIYTSRVDIVFQGHVHSAEFFTSVYQDQKNANGPYYLNIGDGGNKEGLCTVWLKQPPISLFRKAAYGFSNLKVFNATHAEFTWFPNPTKLLQSIGYQTTFVRPFPRT